jgi:hypothetical protein
VTILTRNQRFLAKILSIKLDLGCKDLLLKYNMSYSHRVLSVSYAYDLSPGTPLVPKARRGPGYRLLIFGLQVRCALRMQNQD